MISTSAQSPALSLPGFRIFTVPSISGASAADAPEIDGTVRILKAGKLKAGDWADVEITGADDYDLSARIARTR